MVRTSFMKVGMSVCVVLAMLAVAQTGDGKYEDEWRMKRSGNSGKVHVTLERSRPGSRWMHSSDMPLEHFRGFSVAALDSSGPARFEFVRDAGRLVCTGQFTNCRGIGTFVLVGNPQYASELQRLGYDAPANNQLFSMLMSDVSLEFARGVKEAGIGATTKQLIDMRIHGVSLDYVRGMRASGYTTLTAGDYVEMRIHGVTPELVTELKRAGYDVPAKKIVEMRIHGVTPAYVSELNTYGMKPSASEIVELRVHGVKPEYLKELKDAGYGALPVREVINMRIHGVDGAYLRKLNASGFRNLPPEKIVKLKIHGID